MYDFPGWCESEITSPDRPWILGEFLRTHGPSSAMGHQVWLSQAIRWILTALYLKVIEQSSLAADFPSETRRMRKSLKQAVGFSVT